MFPFFMFAGLFSKKKESQVSEVHASPELYERYFVFSESETANLMKDFENGDPHISFQVYKNLQDYRKLVAKYNEKYQMSMIVSPEEMKFSKREKDDGLEVLREYSRHILTQLQKEAFTGFYWKR